ncbi:MAG: hypothetical protein DCC55_31995, partial [Chloroflexi bacterium]
AERAARYETAPRPLVMILLKLGIALRKSGRTDESVSRLKEALALAQALEDEALQMEIMQALGEAVTAIHAPARV